VSATYEYDGSSWTSGGNLGNATYYSGSWGSQTAGFKVGGAGTGGPQIANSELYDGTSWAAGVSAPSSFYGNTNSGVQSAQGAGLTMSGDSSGTGITAAREYNGPGTTVSVKTVTAS
jgi:hypothetical protein